MTKTVYFECPNCFAENSTEYEHGGGLPDIEPCCECGHELSDEEEEELFPEFLEQVGR